MKNLRLTSNQIQEQIDQLLLESKNNPDFDKQRKIGSLMISKESQIKIEKILKNEVKVPKDIKNARKQLITFFRDHQNFLNGEDVQSCFLIAYGKGILDADQFDKERYEGESWDTIHGVSYWD